MAARDDQCGGVPKDPVHRCDMRGDDRTFRRTPGRDEVGVRGPHLVAVTLVDEADGGEGAADRGCRGATQTAALGHLVQRSQRVVELNDVELLKLVEHRSVLALRRGVLRIELEDLEPPTVQPEVDATAAERPVQLAVVGLPFKPAGRHRSDGRVGIDVRDHLVDRGPALWA